MRINTNLFICLSLALSAVLCYFTPALAEYNEEAKQIIVSNQTTAGEDIIRLQNEEIFAQDTVYTSEEN